MTQLQETQHPQLIDQLTYTCTYSTYILSVGFTDIFAYLSQLVNWIISAIMLHNIIMTQLHIKKHSHLPILAVWVTDMFALTTQAGELNQYERNIMTQLHERSRYKPTFPANR